jgi:hypothetical protein
MEFLRTFKHHQKKIKNGKVFYEMTLWSFHNFVHFQTFISLN